MIAQYSGLGDIEDTPLGASDYLSATFINSDGSINLAMVGLVGVGFYFIYKWFGEGQKKVTKARIGRHEKAIERLKGKNRKQKKSTLKRDIEDEY
jgi:predicted negative regulator of RcsB-dependent stress response